MNVLFSTSYDILERIGAGRDIVSFIHRFTPSRSLSEEILETHVKWSVIFQGLRYTAEAT